MRVIEIIDGKTIRIEKKWNYRLKGKSYSGDLVRVLVDGYEEQYDDEIKQKLEILILLKNIHIKNIKTIFNYTIHPENNRVQADIYLRYRNISYYFPELEKNVKRKHHKNLYTATDINVWGTLTNIFKSLFNKIF